MWALNLRKVPYKCPGRTPDQLRDHVETEAEIGVILSEANKRQGHQKVEEAKKSPPLEPLERTWPLDSER